MKIQRHTFQLINWKKIVKQKSKGLKGEASAQVIKMGDVRIRIVEYSAGYIADHWCIKGHVIYCISGRMISELKNGKKFILKKGMTYKVGDNSDPHRSSTKKGCRLFIVD